MAKITINGEPHDLDVPDEMPLLWVLRDVVGLTGTKYGCGRGLCGACMVHMDGQAVMSCVIPASGADGTEVTTIEGLDPEGQHPVQRAWREADVPQCGYCQPGQIMNAAAFLARSTDPSDREIDQVMARNICRCGTYVRIRQAVRRAAEEMS